MRGVKVGGRPGRGSAALRGGGLVAQTMRGAGRAVHCKKMSFPTACATCVS